MRLALVLLFGAAPAGAVELRFGPRPVRIDITSTTIAAYHTDNDNGDGCDDDYGEALERLNANGSSAPWGFGVRVDTSLYFATPGESDCTQLDNRYAQTPVGNPYWPEKLWVDYRSRTLDVTLGDSYVSFGRGLALSLRKVDELGVDTTLLGGKALLRLGRLEGTLAAGTTNIGNIDEASGKHEDNPFDLVAGAQALVDVGRGVRVGGHGVAFVFHEPTSGFFPPGADIPTYDQRWLLYGPVLDAPRLLPSLGVYLEGLAQRRTNVDDETETGYGAYGTITWFSGKATVLVEGKWYGELAVVQPRFEENEFSSVQYTSPPTVERVLQPLEESQHDVWGGRARFDWAFSPAFLAYLNAGLFRDDADPVAQPDGGWVYDPYAGFEARWDQARSRALFSAGYRVLTPELYPGGGDELARSDLHADLDFVQALTPELSLEVHGIHTERMKNEPLGKIEWREGTLQVGARLRPRWAAAFVYDYTTDPTQDKTHYLSGVAQVDLTPATSVRLSAGANRGGLKCVSGVCRVFPPFEGVKLVGTVRF